MKKEVTEYPLLKDLDFRHPDYDAWANHFGVAGFEVFYQSGKGSVSGNYTKEDLRLVSYLNFELNNRGHVRLDTLAGILKESGETILNSNSKVDNFGSLQTLTRLDKLGFIKMSTPLSSNFQDASTVIATGENYDKVRVAALVTA